MALNIRRTNPAEPVSDPYHSTRLEPISATPIPPIMDNADYSRLFAQQAVLSRAIEQRRQLLERYAIGDELAASSSSAGERKQRLRERLQRMDATFPASVPEPSEAAEGLDPIVARGLALAAGETVPPSPDRDAHIQQARMEIALLDAALRIVHGAMYELKDALSTEVAKLCLPQQQQILAAKRDALLAVAAACDAERRLIAEVIQSGHDHSPGVMRSPPIAPASMLGSTSEYESPISNYLRALKEIGVN
jgi:hypothetical protein